MNEPKRRITHTHTQAGRCNYPFQDTIISKCLKISIGVYKFFYNSESGSVKNRVFLYELKMLQRAGVLLHTIKSF